MRPTQAQRALQLTFQRSLEGRPWVAAHPRRALQAAQPMLPASPATPANAESWPAMEVLLVAIVLLLLVELDIVGLH